MELFASPCNQRARFKNYHWGSEWGKKWFPLVSNTLELFIIIIIKSVDSKNNFNPNTLFSRAFSSNYLQRQRKKLWIWEGVRSDLFIGNVPTFVASSFATWIYLRHPMCVWSRITYRQILVVKTSDKYIVKYII